MKKDRCGSITPKPTSGCQTTKETQTVQPFPISGPLAENLGLPLPVLKAEIGKAEARTHSYVLSSVKLDHETTTFEQHGSAPNFQGGVLTLCTCKHQMRATQFYRQLERCLGCGLHKSHDLRPEALAFLPCGDQLSPRIAHRSLAVDEGPQQECEGSRHALPRRHIPTQVAAAHRKRPVLPQPLRHTVRTCAQAAPWGPRLAERHQLSPRRQVPTSTAAGC